VVSIVHICKDADVSGAFLNDSLGSRIGASPMRLVAWIFPSGLRIMHYNQLIYENQLITVY
jgi:hypothetical protein